MTISNSVPAEQASKTIRRTLVISASIAFLLLVVTCAGVPLYVMNGHPVSIKQLSKIQRGMSQSQVQGILGEPKKKYDQIWTYGGVTWCYVTIRFDDTGNVVSVLHDH